MSQCQIAVVVGSLRKDSYNRKLADAIVKLAPPEFTFRLVQIRDLPLYNQDDDANQVEAVKRLKADIAAAHGLIVVTAEYNRSISGGSRTRSTMPRVTMARAHGQASPPVCWACRPAPWARHWHNSICAMFSRR